MLNTENCVDEAELLEKNNRVEGRQKYVEKGMVDKEWDGNRAAEVTAEDDSDVDVLEGEKYQELEHAMAKFVRELNWSPKRESYNGETTKAEAQAINRQPGEQADCQDSQACSSQVEGGTVRSLVELVDNEISEVLRENRNFFSIVLGGRSYRALHDTGATVSIVGETIANQSKICYSHATLPSNRLVMIT